MNRVACLIRFLHEKIIKSRSIEIATEKEGGEKTRRKKQFADELLQTDRQNERQCNDILDYKFTRLPIIQKTPTP